MEVYKSLHDLPFFNVREKQEIEFKTFHEGELKTSLVIPSKSHSYSMCIEYIKEWFESFFQENFFKSSYIDGKNVIDDFRGLSREQLIKRPRPCYTMIPKIDYEYNREMVDAYHFGTNMFANRTRYKDAFYKNYDNNTFISLEQKLLLLRFNFRIKVTTLSVAQDLFDFMQLAFRAGSTMGREVDLDYHIPNNLMNIVAKDNGFEIENNEVKDITKFLAHMNAHSFIPIMRKRRNATGTYQYFIKIPNSYVHLKISNINIDEGERKGHINTDYNLDFEVEVRFPSPKFYAYYSRIEYHYIQDTDPNSGIINLYDYPVVVPKVNDKGWQQYLTTEYIVDEEEFEEKKPISVDFSELVGDIRTAIDYTKSIYLSPSLFVDMKLYNNGVEIESAIEWNSYTVTTKNPIKDRKVYMIIYVDLNYLNNNIIKNTQADKNRITPYKESKIVRG